VFCLHVTPQLVTSEIKRWNNFQINSVFLFHM